MDAEVVFVMELRSGTMQEEERREGSSFQRAGSMEARVRRWSPDIR